jgi:hypothetical protein
LDIEYREAQALAEVWDKKAMVAKGWLAKVEGSAVVIARRKVDDTFAASIAEALAKVPAPPVVPDLEEQLALLAKASAMMREEAAAPPKPRQEEPSEEERLRQGRFRSREEAEEYLLRQRTLGNAAGK